MTAPTTCTPVRLAVLLSGSGRTLDTLLARSNDGTLDAHIVLVIASRECLGADKARAAGLPTLVLQGTIPADILEDAFRRHDVHAAALAGYLCLVRVPRSYRGRIVNIHPALLPEFGGRGMHGMHVHEAVIARGMLTSGCTVHLVDDTYDTGAHLLQVRCPVLASDTPQTLANRVFACEQLAYPLALSRWCASLPREVPA